MLIFDYLSLLTQFSKTISCWGIWDPLANMKLLTEWIFLVLFSSQFICINIHTVLKFSKGLMNQLLFFFRLLMIHWLGENKLLKNDFFLFSFGCILSIRMSKLLDGFAIKTDPCDFLPSKAINVKSLNLLGKGPQNKHAVVWDFRIVMFNLVHFFCCQKTDIFF